MRGMGKGGSGHRHPLASVAVDAIARRTGKALCLRFPVNPVRKESTDNMITDREFIHTRACRNHVTCSVRHRNTHFIQRHCTVHYSEIMEIKRTCADPY